jgi:repressor LexA
MSDPRALTKRQDEILRFLRDFTRDNGYPPSVREIGDAVGLSSSSTVHSHLRALENKGYVRRDSSQARALTIIDGMDSAENNAPGEAPDVFREVVALPLVGRVAAGEPILAEQNIEDTFPMPAQVVGDTGSFMLAVHGDSMIDAGILDGDYVVVREQHDATNGDIVVAMLGDGATVKTFYREPDRIRLQPQNPTMSPIYSTDVHIVGKVTALIRRF